MTTVEFIYDHDCSNVSMTRAQLLRAFSETGIHPRWTEWERSDPQSPDYVRGYGSPTILVDGKDVAGVPPSEGISCCRLYPGASGETQGVPPIPMIASSLRGLGRGKAPRERLARNPGWRSSLASLPGIGAALMPVGVCPACWPVYAGLLSSTGLGFLLNTAFLLPVMAVLLLVAVSALAFRAQTRRGYGPFAAGLLATGAVLFGKFVVTSNATMYGGIVLLVVATVWNAWPRKAVDIGSGACSACAPEGQASFWHEPPGAKEVSS